jgi:hypothetical protein
MLRNAVGAQDLELMRGDRKAVPLERGKLFGLGLGSAAEHERVEHCDCEWPFHQDLRFRPARELQGLMCAALFLVQMQYVVSHR